MYKECRCGKGKARWSRDGLSEKSGGRKACGEKFPFSGNSEYKGFEAELESSLNNKAASLCRTEGGRRE